MSKELLKLKTSVIKRVPRARCLKSNGGFYIWDGNGNLMEEYLIPIQPNEYKAWYVYDLILKTHTNIQRTHPNRMSNEDVERKLIRLSKRRKVKAS